MPAIEDVTVSRFKRFMSARELHVFYTPQPDEIAWAREAAGSDEHLLALVVPPCRCAFDIASTARR